MKELDREEKETILIGDTNCDFKSNHTGNAKKLKQIYAEFQFSQMINKYTRVAVTRNERKEQRTTKTLTDHFSTTSPKRILRADVLRIGIVDHYMVYGISNYSHWDWGLEKLMHGDSKGKTKRKLLRLVALPNTIKYHSSMTYAR